MYLTSAFLTHVGSAHTTQSRIFKSCFIVCLYSCRIEYTQNQCVADIILKVYETMREELESKASETDTQASPIRI